MKERKGRVSKSGYVIAGCGYAKLTSYRSLVYENFHNTSDQGHGDEMTRPRDEKGVGGEPR